MRPSVYWQGYGDAWHAEWIKARTLASTGWLLATTVVLGVGLSGAVCAVVHDQAGGGQDPTDLALSGIQLAQASIAILAVRIACGEYRSEMISITLTAIPRRGNVLAAKSTVITALALAAGTITVTGSLLVAHAELTENGFAAGPTLRAAFGSVLYLGLISLLATGTALAVRDSAAATGLVLGLLYLVPLAAQLAGNATWQRHLRQIGPSTGGLAVLATWAAAALLAGGTRLRR